MSSLIEGYYHCNECDSIFESIMIGAPQQICPHCGNVLLGDSDVSSALGVGGGFLLSEDEEVELGFEKQEVGDDESYSSDARGKQAGEQSQKATSKEGVAMQLKVVSISWIALVVLVVAVVLYFNRSADEFAKSEDPSGNKVVEQSDAGKHAIKLALPKCMRVAKEFLNAKTASAKAQFVYQGVRLSREMEAYYARQPDFPPRLIQLRPVYHHSLDIPGVEAIGTICQTDTGERFEAIFIKEGKEWKIEWKSFVRYSESDWSLFTSKRSGDEAEFRLYMRVMDVGEDLAGGDILVQFYKPDIFRGHMFDGYASESIRVPIYSTQGRLLGNLVNQADSATGQDQVGMQISDFDPQHFERVRVRVKLQMNSKQEPYVELVRLMANHWYDPAIVEDNGLPEESE